MGRAAAAILMTLALVAGARGQAVLPAADGLPVLDVIAPADLAPYAAQIERFDRHRFAPIMRLVGVATAGDPIRVIVAAEASDLGTRTPPWIAGFASAQADTIVVFPARTPAYPHDSLEALLHHEVAHILISRAARGAAVPRWFHEGLAMAAERPWGIGDHTRVALALAGARRPIAMLEGDFDGGERAAARAYAVSGAFVRDLLRRHGPGLPSRVLSGLADGLRVDAAYLGATGETLDSAEQVFWRESWWYQVIPFVTSSLAIWAGIIFLAFLAMRRRAGRRAAQRQAWDEEEADEEEARDPT